MTIHIDLNNLTQAHIDEAAPNIRECTYSSPCIIGALMTPEEQLLADRPLEDTVGSMHIGGLVKAGRVVLADPGQLCELKQLQEAFDHGDVDDLIELLDRRGLKWTGMSQEEAEDLVLC
ncbi:hypothetical protein KNJ79_05240 [Sphingopyxis indica]|uniref:hypothetical protein n=1 Tax=Sphingopyxis indica TaxID=436663 RepID=UPI002938E432|nr:hypothetical protein [Sphingopyxis indica]WOF44337.1 hypothetical protein KNJ79_05240 [Sphingopyxis indica]